MAGVAVDDDLALCCRVVARTGDRVPWCRPYDRRQRYHATRQADIVAQRAQRARYARAARHR